MEGTVLAGRYRLVRRIGQGGAGSVYRADNLELGNEVAVKVLDTSRCTEESIARFLREAEVLARIAHPGAVRVLDRGRTDEGTLWIAMELLEGETLEARLRRGVFFPGDLVELLQPLCEVLTEAHGKGIVHRDLKPSNVMLVPTPGGGSAPRLFDFGIAGLRGDDSVTDPDLVSGTPRYMAPEQWQGLGFTDQRSDVYSLGVIAYECLSGALPLEADGAMAWLNKHRHENPRALREAMAGRPLPRGMHRAIMRALAKNPEERPPTALALWNELRAGLHDGIAGEPRTLDRRSIMRWGAALAVPVVAAGAGAWWIRRRGRSTAGACPPLAGSHMPLALGNWWRYRVLEPVSRRPQAEEKTIRLDRTEDVGGLKAGTIAFRLARTDATGSAYRWLSRADEAVVWHHDQWFDRVGALTRSVYFQPWRLRVDDACDHRVAGVTWTTTYDRIDVDLVDPSKHTAAEQREVWTVEAVDEPVVVPAGAFRCIRLRRHRDGDTGQRDSWYWYAAGVGKIREDSPPEELEELTAYGRDA